MKQLLVTSITALLVLSCNGSDGTTSASLVCEPGETQSCLGSRVCSGVQGCRADGSGWEACVCDGGVAGAAGAPVYVDIGGVPGDIGRAGATGMGGTGGAGLTLTGGTGFGGGGNGGETGAGGSGGRSGGSAGGSGEGGAAGAPADDNPCNDPTNVFSSDPTQCCQPCVELYCDAELTECGADPNCFAEDKTGEFQLLQEQALKLAPCSPPSSGQRK